MIRVPPIELIESNKDAIFHLNNSYLELVKSIKKESEELRAAEMGLYHEDNLEEQEHKLMVRLDRLDDRKIALYRDLRNAQI